MSAIPSASVIVPCFNSARTLMEQLGALNGQTGIANFEVILADNGSTDSTRDMIGAAHLKFPIRWVDASRVKGPSYARSIGAVAASADLLCFCDSDDVVAEGWLKAMVDVLTGEDVLVTGPQRVFVDGQVPRTSPPTEAPGDQGVAERFNYLGFASGCNFGCRKRTFIELGGFDLSFSGACEDVEFSWRFQEAGRNLVYQPEALVYYRLRATPKSMYWQQYTWARDRVQLWERSLREGRPVTGGVSWKCMLNALVRASRIDRSESPIDRAAQRGRALGDLVGHLRFRLLRRIGNQTLALAPELPH